MIDILQTKDFKECISINICGKKKFLGSKYNFLNDLNKLIKEINENKNINNETNILIIGLYNAEYIEKLKSVLSNTNKIIIFEFNKCIYERYKYKVPKDCELIILDEEIKENTFFNYENINKIINNMEVFVFGNYHKIYNKEIKYFYECLKQKAIEYIANKNTKECFSEIWQECFLRNILHIKNSSLLINYKDVFENYPAIIVSAGPSLEKNIKYLKNIQEKAVIISGGRTLNTLLKNGINPTLVCIIDSSEESYKLIRHNLNCEVPLVTIDVGYTKIIEKYKGKKIFFNHIGTINAFNDIFGEKSSKCLFSGGSVAHSSMDLAKYLGCKDIIFIGQDLAYTDNKHHSSCTTFEDDDIEMKYDLMVEDIVGNKIPTSHELNFFKLNIEKYIEICNENYPNIKFINATEGGANIKGTKIKELKQIVKLYKNNNILPKIDFKDDCKNIDSNSIKNKLLIANKELEKIKTLSCNILKINEKLLKFYKKNFKINNQYIDVINKNEIKIIKNIKSTYIITLILQPLIENVMNVNYIFKKDSSLAEKVNLNYLRTNELYGGLNKSIIQINKIIEEIIQKL